MVALSGLAGPSDIRYQFPVRLVASVQVFREVLYGLGLRGRVYSRIVP